MTEAIIIGMEQAILLDLFTEEELQAKRESADAHSKEVIDSHLEAKAKAESDAKVLDAFTTALNSLELPTVPSGVLNIYRAYRKDFRPIHKDEVKAVLKANTNLDEVEVGNRMIELDTYSWGEWTINKALTSTTTKASGSATKERKLAITVSSREGNNLTFDGNFRTSKEACEHYGFATLGDSARRVLEAKKKIVDDYDGDDFLVKQV